MLYLYLKKYILYKVVYQNMLISLVISMNQTKFVLTQNVKEEVQTVLKFLLQFITVQMWKEKYLGDWIVDIKFFVWQKS